MTGRSYRTHHNGSHGDGPAQGRRRAEEEAADLLERHFQQMIRGGAYFSETGHNRPEVISAASQVELVSLMELAERLHRLIYPVQPSPHFRAELRQALLAAHRRRAAPRSLPAEREGIPTWLVTAIPVLLGILAYLWRRSHRPEQVQAEGVP